MAPPAKRRRDGTKIIPIESLINEGKKKKPRRGLQQIHGREGDGAFDFKALAKSINVSMSLMDLFQISPEVSKQFRHFSTRKNAKAEKRAARKIAALKKTDRKGKGPGPSISMENRDFTYKKSQTVDPGSNCRSLWMDLPVQHCNQIYNKLDPNLQALVKPPSVQTDLDQYTSYLEERNTAWRSSLIANGAKDLAQVSAVINKKVIKGMLQGREPKLLTFFEDPSG
ncbi:hypothetical protein F5Y05DRAFT_414600 [Hypoxylon sp. FL0543]|nr:hypothetical protein F5Y05DRAFT_414600 [Hypoxylon sp. FL0543]